MQSITLLAVTMIKVLITNIASQKKNLIIDILSWKQSWAPCSALEMLCHCMHVA